MASLQDRKREALFCSVSFGLGSGQVPLGAGRDKYKLVNCVGLSKGQVFFSSFSCLTSFLEAVMMEMKSEQCIGEG